MEIERERDRHWHLQRASTKKKGEFLSSIIYGDNLNLNLYTKNKNIIPERFL